ncbi:tRNA methyl transferase PRC-barrel domain-containing protein, partial [Rhizobiaceae sp. 2RAB30]
GRHDGILRYTIGQRRGIGIASGEPLYVVHLDADRARVIVGPREALETHKIFLRGVNWLGDVALSDIPEEGLELYAKVRSTRPPRPAMLHQRAGKIWVELAQGESGIAPGQACVLYSDDGNEARVFGGGFIERSERGAEAEAMLSRLAATPAHVPAE